MSKLAYTGKLGRQILQFAYRQKVYWIVPLMVVLGLVILLGGSFQSAGTVLLYTLF